MKTFPVRYNLLVFALISLVSLWVGFFWFGNTQIFKVVIYTGYPSLFIASGIFLWSSVHMFRKGVFTLEILPRNRLAWISLLAIAAFLLLVEPLEFKIVYDEPVLSASAQLMHFQRLAAVPYQGNDYLGSYVLMESFLDKRPFFFPFLLSLVHDFSGFRLENAFYLNACLTIVLLFLLFIASKMFAGEKGGILAVLMAGTLPLLAIFANSGHFEILNLVMITLVVILSVYYLEKPESLRLTPLVFALLLLTQVRYENSLYLLPFGILILLGWKKAGRVLLPWPVMISPLFLIIYALQFRMMQTSEFSFFQAGPNNRTDTFSLSYVGENMESIPRFFLHAGMDMPNSYLLTVLGIPAITFILIQILRKRSIFEGEAPKATTFLVFSASIVLYTAVLCAFNFGLLDRYITHRLSLPINLLLILSIPIAYCHYKKPYVLSCLIFGVFCAMLNFNQLDREMLLSGGILLGYATAAYAAAMFYVWRKTEENSWIFLIIPVLFLLTVTMPKSHAQKYSHKYRNNDMLMEQIFFIKRHKDKERLLFVAGNQYAALLTRTNSTFISKLNSHPSVAREHMERKMYNSIYVSRRFERLENGEWDLIKPEQYLDPEVFELETLYEKFLDQNVVLRFSKLINVHLDEHGASQDENKVTGK